MSHPRSPGHPSDLRLRYAGMGALALAALAVRLAFVNALPLFPDEAYYYLWSGRLAPGFVDHPAGVAVMLRLSTVLGGSGEAGIRWLNALLSTACVPLAYSTGRHYVSGLGGWVAAAVMAFAPVYVLTGRISYPDSLLYLMILAFLLALRPLISHTGELRITAWLALGIAAGMMLNVKLNALFVLLGFGCYCLLWRRDLLKRRELWLAAGIALLLVIPFLTWNATKGFPTFRAALAQAAGYSITGATPLEKLSLARRYHTLPVVLLALASAAAVVCATLNARRDRAAASVLVGGPLLLTMIALLGTLPVILSSANNPRVLGTSLLTWWPLAGLAPLGQKPFHRTLLAALVAATAITGIGTVATTAGFDRIPQSIGAFSIRESAVGWPELARQFQPPQGVPIFTTDYSTAPLLEYYGKRPAYASWEQWRIWGYPEFNDLAVVSGRFLPPGEVEARLRADFATVIGPQSWTAPGSDEVLAYTWFASGRRAPVAMVVEDLDFLNLLHSLQGPSPAP